MRLALASIVSILAVILATASLLMGLMFFANDSSAFGIAVAIVMGYAIGSTIGVIVVGLPTHALLSRYGVTSALPYVCIGFAVSCSAAIVLKPFGDGLLQKLLTQAFLSGFLGAVCAFAFWVVAVKFARPNPSFKQDAAQKRGAS